MEFGFVRAVAFLIFLAVAQADAVIFVEVITQFAQIAVLFQFAALIDFPRTVFVVAVVQEVAGKQCIKTVLVGIDGGIAACTFVGADCRTQFEAEWFSVNQ